MGSGNDAYSRQTAYNNVLAIGLFAKWFDIGTEHRGTEKVPPRLHAIVFGKRLR